MIYKITFKWASLKLHFIGHELDPFVYHPLINHVHYALIYRFHALD